MLNTFFKWFPSYLRPCLASGNNVEKANKSVCIQAVDIESTCARDIFARSTYAGNNSSVVSIYIKAADLENISSKNISIKSACTKRICDVEHSKIYSQFCESKKWSYLAQAGSHKQI